MSVFEFIEACNAVTIDTRRAASLAPRLVLFKNCNVKVVSSAAATKNAAPSVGVNSAATVAPPGYAGYAPRFSDIKSKGFDVYIKD